ncbi:MAG: hypothetical protein ACKPGK_15270, partial [Verrucomicrobiota bacterium]
GAWRSTLLRVQRTLEEFGFRTPAEIGLRFQSDLNRPAESSAELTLSAGEVSWKGRSFERLSLESRASPQAGRPGYLALGARWTVDGVVADEGNLGSLRGSVDLVQPVDAVLPDRADWRLDLEGLETPRLRLAGVTLEGVSVRSASNTVPLHPWDPRQPMRTESQPAPRFESTVRLTVRGVAAGVPEIRLAEASAGLVVDHGLPGWHRARLDLRSPGMRTPWLETGPVELRLTATPRAPEVAVVADPSFWRWIRPFRVDGDLRPRRCGIPGWCWTRSKHGSASNPRSSGSTTCGSTSWAAPWPATSSAGSTVGAWLSGRHPRRIPPASSPC